MQGESPVQSFLVWLEGEAPSVYATLASPATARSLDLLARKWGELPDDFLELYRAHDGQVREDVDLLPSYCLMPISDILRWRSNLDELEGELDEDEEKGWDDAWILFAQLPVYLQFLCLDVNTGEVVAYDHKAPDSFVIARSFGELLTHVRIAVKQRQFVVTEKGIAHHPNHPRWRTAWAEACEPSKPRKPRKASKTRKPKKKPKRRERSR